MMRKNFGKILAKKLLEKYKNDPMNLYLLGELVEALNNNEEVSNELINKFFNKEFIEEIYK
jgi:hypothetical protein